MFLDLTSRASIIAHEPCGAVAAESPLCPFIPLWPLFLRPFEIQMFLRPPKRSYSEDIS